MLSRNFYHRIKYQIDKKATNKVLFQFILDRLKHPFQKFQKKRLKKQHQIYLRTKKTSTDYFSINAYYWKSIINKNFNDFSYMEIGSWEGNSALFILNNFKTKKVFCVDIWDKHNNEFKDRDKELDVFDKRQKLLFENFKFNMEEFKERFSFFNNTSDNFFVSNKEKFDIIYVDGWHEAPQVYKDINNSWNFLNINGIIICDDYFYGNITNNSDNNLPANAINKFIKEKKDKIEIICVNNTQIFIKKILN